MKTLQEHISRQITKIAGAEAEIKSTTGNHRKNLIKKVCGWKQTLKHLQKLNSFGIVKN